MDQTTLNYIVKNGADALGKFAQAAGQTATHLYGVIVRQQVIEGIMGLVGTGVFLLLVGALSIPMWKLLRHINKKVEKAKYLADWPIFAYSGWVALAIVLLITSIAVVSNIEDAVGHLLNPEYYAIQFIFNGVQGNAKK